MKINKLLSQFTYISFAYFQRNKEYASIGTTGPTGNKR